jgi:hypothetical protein
MSEQQPTEEELRAALEEEMRRLTPDDVIVQTTITLVNLAGRKLGLAAPQGDTDKDLEQAHKAIEGVRALLPLVPKEPQAPIREALSQLQMAYVQASKAGGEQPERKPDERPEEKPKAEPESPSDEAERAKARSKIWTPPGS